MKKPSFLKRLPAVIAVAAILSFLSIPAAFSQDISAGQAAVHNRQGMEYFKKGFYEHTPKNQAVEAERNYALAAKEFKAAIVGDDSFTDAHRNLARLYYIRKNFDGAAVEYRKVTELAPGDMDAYVNLALSLIELKRPAEAIQTLESAKGHTSDPKALQTLDSYITKVRAYQEKGVR